MSRNAVFSALVLRSRPSGESNSEVSLLTVEEGIIKATVFGGPKSKLRSHTAPYNSGKVWIYRDPAKEYSKLSDFDVHSWRPGLRELYERTMAAAGIAETILYTHAGGGSWDFAMKLAVLTLDALENANEELCSRLQIYFLWRWAHFLGIQPHIEACAACGDRVENGALWYNAREGAVFCANCAEKATVTISINPGCRRWLSAAEQLEPALLSRYSMDNKSFNEAKALTTAVMTAALGKRLASWDWH